MTPKLSVTCYALESLPDEIQPGRYVVEIQRTLKWNDGHLWAARISGLCVNNLGQWEHEPFPSERDEAFLARCRFKTPEEAGEMAMRAGHPFSHTAVYS